MTARRGSSHKQRRSLFSRTRTRRQRSQKGKDPAESGQGQPEYWDELKSAVEQARQKAEWEYRSLEQQLQHQKPSSERKAPTKQTRSQTPSQAFSKEALKARPEQALDPNRQKAPKNKAGSKRRIEIFRGALKAALRFGPKLGHWTRHLGHSIIQSFAQVVGKIFGQHLAQVHTRRQKYRQGSTSQQSLRQRFFRTFRAFRSWNTLLSLARRAIARLGHWALQGLLQLINILLAPGFWLFRTLHALLHPSQLFQHYRRSFCHWRRMLFLRQCFYFSFSLSCFCTLLASAWLVLATQQWQQKLQGELQGLFVVLEEQYGVQIRFRLQWLYLLHQLKLSDIQVRLQAPLQGLQSQNAAREATPQLPRVHSIPPLRPAAPSQNNTPSQPNQSPNIAQLLPAQLWAQLARELPAAQYRQLQQFLSGGASAELGSPQTAALIPASYTPQTVSATGEGILLAATEGSPQGLPAASSAATPEQSLVQLYVQVNQLRLQFSLAAVARHSWEMLRETLTQPQDKQPLSPLQIFQRLPQLQGKAAWQLFRLLNNIQKLSLDQVEVELFTAELHPPLSPPLNAPAAGSDDQAAAAVEFPFSWQEFLQILRAFPIEIHSLQLNFNFWQQLFEGQDIRLVLQRQQLPREVISQQPDTQLSLAAPTILQPSLEPGWWHKVWQAFLAWFPTYSQDRDLQSAPRPEPALSQAQNRIQALTQQPHSYLFDLQGKFHSRINSSPEQAAAPQLAFWGQLHANGGLSRNFDQAYLILELQEFHSNYASLRPIQFQVEYQPAALKLKALSKIRTLDWELQYLFGQQELDLQLWADNFRLGDYLVLGQSNSDNAALVRALQPFLGARLSGQSQLALLLPSPQSASTTDSPTPTLPEPSQVPQISEAPMTGRASPATPLQMQYSGKMQAYLPQFDLSLAFDGSGDLNGLQARELQASQDSWQARFRGDLPYRNLLPNGILNFEWRSSSSPEKSGNEASSNSGPNEFGYRGTYLFQRSGDNSLIIDSLHSQFSGLGLPAEQLLPSLSLLAPSSQPEDQPQQLALGLPPWAQPQLRTFVFFQEGNYHLSAQLRLPLSPAQMQNAEQSLNSELEQNPEQNSGQSDKQPVSLYRGSALYPAERLYRYLRQQQREQQAATLLSLPGDPTAQYRLPDASIPLPSFLPAAEPPAGQSQPDLGEASFYLLPLFSLYATLSPGSPRSPLELELSSLEWDEQKQSIDAGQVPLAALLGGSPPDSAEFLFPGLSRSYLEIRSSLLSNFQSFQLWLEEFRLRGPDSQQNLLIQGTANSEQLDLEKLQLRWDALKVDNHFLWNIAKRSGEGLLELQDQPLNYQLRQLLLPHTTPEPESQNTQPDIQPGAQQDTKTAQVSSPSQYGWLLQGDYQLYSYFDPQRYQLAFERLPLPRLPGLNQFVAAQQVGTQNSLLDNISSLLSLKISGSYPDWQENFYRQDWQINVPSFRLEIPESGPYFPQGAELRFNGFWRPDQLRFQQLALLEPQRLLQGQGSLDFIRPVTPVSPIARISARQSIAAPLTSPVSSTSSTQSISSPQNPFAATGDSSIFAPSDRSDSSGLSPYTQIQRARPQALPLPQKLSEEMSDKEPGREADEGYWQGQFRLQGALTEVGIRDGASQIEGGENLELDLRTEGQQFRASARGQLDATRLTQLINLLQGKQRQGLDRGTLKFELQTDGQYRSSQLPGSSQDDTDSGSFQLQFAQLQGRWQLTQASYSGRELEIGSQLLWRNSQTLNPSRQNALLLSDIQGRFGQLLLQRSFLSYRGNPTEQQKLSGLLNYSVQIGRNDSYRSSIALNLLRDQTALTPGAAVARKNFDSVEQELLRWNGSLYSYPLRAYSQFPEQSLSSSSSLADIGDNLRQNVFNETRSAGPSIRQVYPGFDIFLHSRIVAESQEKRNREPNEEPNQKLSQSANLGALAGRNSEPNAAPTDDSTPEQSTAFPLTAELHLYRHNPAAFEMGIRSRSFWLNVGRAFPISFRAQGSSDGQDIDAQVEQLTIEPSLLNVLMPDDAILQQPIFQFANGQISGSLRLYGTLLNPAVDGTLQLQRIQLHSPYFPDNSPTIDIELVSEGHIIMAKPFRIQFGEGTLYSSGYEAAYLRHQNLQINRYYLGFSAEGKEGIPIFYDAYGIQYAANAKGSATLEGTDQSGYLNASFNFNHLLMQGSPTYKQLQTSESELDDQAHYPFSLDIRAKIGRSARLAYPQEASPIFTSRLNPRDELLISYDGNEQEGSIEGRVSLYSGELYLLGNQMELRKGELVFDETFVNFSPDITLFFSLYTYDQQGQNIQINMDYQGDLASLAEQNWSPTLYSQPPLSEQQLRYLVAAQLSSGGGAITDDLNAQQNQLLSGVLSQLGSSVVLKPLEEFIRREFKFDEVNLKTDLLGNLLNDYLGSNYNTASTLYGVERGATTGIESSLGTAASDWLKYLDNTQISFGAHLNRDNTILLSFNIDLLYKPQDTKPVLFSRNGLQVVPGLGLTFSTPLLDISWNIGFAHYDDFFITDSSLALEWSLSDFLNRKRLAALERRDEQEENVSDEIVAYAEE